MSNFTFLKTNWPDLYETAREAEQNINSAPRTTCFYARRSLERAVKWLYTVLNTVKSNKALNDALFSKLLIEFAKHFTKLGRI